MTKQAEQFSEGAAGVVVQHFGSYAPGPMRDIASRWPTRLRHRAHAAANLDEPTRQLLVSAADKIEQLECCVRAWQLTFKNYYYDADTQAVEETRLLGVRKQL